MPPSGKTHLFFIILGVVLLTPKIAHAYINPGAGSVLFQIILAMIVTSVFVAKAYLQKIKGVLLRIFSKKRKKP